MSLLVEFITKFVEEYVTDTVEDSTKNTLPFFYAVNSRAYYLALFFGLILFYIIIENRVKIEKQSQIMNIKSWVGAIFIAILFYIFEFPHCTYSIPDNVIEGTLVRGVLIGSLIQGIIAFSISGVINLIHYLRTYSEDRPMTNEMLFGRKWVRYLILGSTVLASAYISLWYTHSPLIQDVNGRTLYFVVFIITYIFLIILWKSLKILMYYRRYR